MVRVSAFREDALGDLDAVGLAAAIKAKRVSRREVIEAAIARTKAVNTELNALAFEAFDQALAGLTAVRSEGGYFDGVPTYVKDNAAVAGMPTMHGTDTWTSKRAAAHGDFARAYLRTGVVVLGKTQISELGFSPSSEHPRLGPVRNPWNPKYTVGASSAGSAALVAAGAVPIAHANDGGGSIRIPASCSGVVGLKPSRGRVPLDQAMRRLPIDIVANGVLTRSVRDTAAFYREMEAIAPNRKLPPIGDVTGPGKRRLKIAFSTRSIHRECSPEIRDLTLKSAALLEQLGHHVEPLDVIPVPMSFVDDFVLYWGLLAKLMLLVGSRLEGVTLDRERLDSLTLGLDRFAGQNLHRIPMMLLRLSTLRRATERLYRTYDAVLLPTVAHETPRIGHLDPTGDYQQIMDRLMDWVAFTPLQNVTGEPAISLPLAESAAGLPVGMMLAAGMGQEAMLLELAYELEEACPFRRIQDYPSTPPTRRIVASAS